MKNPITSMLVLVGTMSVLGFLAAAPLAHASAPSWDRIWTPNSVTACKRLPLSEWGICKAEVVARERGSLAATQSRYPASYTAAVAACAKLPHSEQGICDAGAPMHARLQTGASATAQQLQPMASAPLASGIAPSGNEIDSRYRAALDACHALPHSEHSSCESEATLLPHAIG
ncbi:MAG: hypothetical protein KGL70_15765 [Betaproteobacteria bacterium]|nr:hypothetical protein [Betaproteobacteria bacterium]MDE2360829.1 hypothetical protein [Betaproteobacteria bacterium]